MRYQIIPVAFAVAAFASFQASAGEVSANGSAKTGVQVGKGSASVQQSGDVAADSTVSAKRKHATGAKASAAGRVGATGRSELKLNKHGVDTPAGVNGTAAGQANAGAAFDRAGTVDAQTGVTGSTGASGSAGVGGGVNGSAGVGANVAGSAGADLGVGGLGGNLGGSLGASGSAGGGVSLR
jgi:hypothetical protein